MTKKGTFAIVGGGIGGLTAAIALQQKGLNVKVYESAPVFRPVGAGIVLASNALKAYRAIGIEDEVLSAGRELKRFAIKNLSGNYLNLTQSEKISRKFGAANSVMLHRADLHSVLVKHLHPGTIVPARSCVGFSQGVDNIKLQFADGSTAEEDVVIAADGIHSVFRKKLIPKTKLRYSGYTCWRGIVNNVPNGLIQDEATETWGRGKRFGIVPLSENRVYWFATVDSPPGDAHFSSFGIDEIKSLYREFHAPVQNIIGLTKSSDLIRSDIFDFIPVSQYSFGKIVLIGDAAHATTPNLGQGACMAIEDAVVLADCISREENVETALTQFEKLRIVRNTKIVNASYSLGKVSQIRNPLLAVLRDSAIRITPEWVGEKQLRFLYDITFV